MQLARATFIPHPQLHEGPMAANKGQCNGGDSADPQNGCSSPPWARVAPFGQLQVSPYVHSSRTKAIGERRTPEVWLCSRRCRLADTVLNCRLNCMNSLPQPLMGRCRPHAKHVSVHASWQRRLLILALPLVLLALLLRHPGGRPLGRLPLHSCQLPLQLRHVLLCLPQLPTQRGGLLLGLPYSRCVRMGACQRGVSAPTGTPQHAGGRRFGFGGAVHAACK